MCEIKAWELQKVQNNTIVKVQTMNCWKIQNHPSVWKWNTFEMNTNGKTRKSQNKQERRNAVPHEPSVYLPSWKEIKWTKRSKTGGWVYAILFSVLLNSTLWGKNGNLNPTHIKMRFNLKPDPFQNSIFKQKTFFTFRNWEYDKQNKNWFLDHGFNKSFKSNILFTNWYLTIESQ